MNKFNKIIEHDLSDYVQEKSSNGGQYLYETEYRKVENGFEIHHFSSAEFKFCECCGCFGNCSCDGQFKIISFDEMSELIEEFQEDENHFLEFQENENEEDDEKFSSFDKMMKDFVDNF